MARSAFQAQLDKFVDDRLREAKAGREDAERISARGFLTIVLVIAAVALINIVLVLLLSRSLQLRLAAIQARIAGLRQGDLTERLPTPGKDELSQIATAFNEFVGEV